MSFAPNYALKTRLKRHASQKGMTLVELMVAMAIGMFMLVAISLVYMSSKTGFVYANNTVQMSEDASFAVDSISRDIRMAGYAGCAGSVIKRTVGTDTTLYDNTDGSRTGSVVTNDAIDNPKSSATSLSTPNLFNVATWPSNIALDSRPNLFKPAMATAAGTAVFSAADAVYGVASGTAGAADRLLLHPTTPASYTVSPTAPMLYLAGGSEQALQVTAAVAKAVSPATQTLTISTNDPYKWANNFTSGKSLLMIISDCRGAEVFVATNMAAATGTLTAAAPFINNYTSDALVMPLVSSTYFLATRTGANTASLYRRYFNGVLTTSGTTSVQFEELVPNVEALTFQYGENTTLNAAGNAATFRVDTYNTDANTVAFWERVVNIRMGLIMVSSDASQGYTTATSFNWVGGTYSVPTGNTTDRRLRRAYSTTVSIRNRMGL